MIVNVVITQTRTHLFINCCEEKSNRGKIWNPYKQAKQRCALMTLADEQPEGEPEFILVGSLSGHQASKDLQKKNKSSPVS